MLNKEDVFLYKCIEKFLEEKKNEQMIVKTTRMEKVVEILIIGIIFKHLIQIQILILQAFSCYLFPVFGCSYKYLGQRTYRGLFFFSIFSIYGH